MNWVVRFFTEVKIKSLFRVFRFNREPVIICGCGRSGTSLLLAILDAHPHIKGIDYETNIFVWKRYFRSPRINGFIHRLRIFNQLIRDNIKPSARRWCEKTPRNVLYLEQILKELNEKVKIIHIIRDGRDVCTSYHPTTKGYHVPIYRWIQDVDAGLAFADHPKVLTMRYENLVQKFDETIRVILDFLNEPYTGDLISFHKTSQINDHSAWFNGIRPLDTTSIGKWKRKEHEERMRDFYQDEKAMDQLRFLKYIE
jgi:hypothetical protein